MNADGSVASFDPVQGSFDELGTPLHEVTFCVFDIETTGGSPDLAAITEIAAVKVRGGEVLGEFATLVRSEAPIPAFISDLTGITDSMLGPAPPLEAVLPMFLEFARCCVLVAHNASFDVSFLRAACARLSYTWPDFRTVDTADLARRALTSDETPNCRLSTLAHLFQTSAAPCHRALADARATVDVLHGLLERYGSLGVHSLDALANYTRPPSPVQRRKRHLAEGLPHAPGVYIFEDDSGQALYLGKSHDLRERVLTFFTGNETRARVLDMLRVAERVVPIECPTGIEADVRELRLIAERRPSYSKRSRTAGKAVWLKLTAEPFPRLVIARRLKDDGATYLGPFSSTGRAKAARGALHEVFPLRQCTGRLTPGDGVPCALYEMNRCGAPCAGKEARDDYLDHVGAAREAMTRNARLVVETISRRAATVAQQRPHDAAAGREPAHDPDTTRRDRLNAFIRAAARTQRLAAFRSCAEVVASRPTFHGGFEVAVIRYGRLVGSAAIPDGSNPADHVDEIADRAAPASCDSPPTSGRARPTSTPALLPGASPAESECLLRWLDGPGVRLLAIDGVWCCPVHGAEALRHRLDREERTTR